VPGARPLDDSRPNPSASPTPKSERENAPAGSAAAGTGAAAGAGTADDTRWASGPAPGFREQVGRTRDSARRLFAAHRDLAQAELGDILDEVKAVAVLAGIAFAAVLLAGLIIPIGLSLFLGEWLFGSLGWGVLHGPLLLIGIGTACVLRAIGLPGGSIGARLLLAIILGIVVGIVLGLDLTNQGWRRLGEAIAPTIEPGVRPLVVGAAVGALVLAILGLIAGLRRGAGGAFGGLIAGAVAGALLGAFTAIAFGPRVGAAVGLTVALIAWPALMGLAVARQGIDTEALKARFWPDETIETTKETIEWVRERAPLGRRS
jgi:MFS family permease